MKIYIDANRNILGTYSDDTVVPEDAHPDSTLVVADESVITYTEVERFPAVDAVPEVPAVTETDEDGVEHVIFAGEPEIPAQPAVTELVADPLPQAVVDTSNAAIVVMDAMKASCVTKLEGLGFTTEEAEALTS